MAFLELLKKSNLTWSRLAEKSETHRAVGNDTLASLFLSIARITQSISDLIQPHADTETLRKKYCKNK